LEDVLFDVDEGNWWDYDGCGVSGKWGDGRQIATELRGVASKGLLVVEALNEIVLGEGGGLTVAKVCCALGVGQWVDVAVVGVGVRADGHVVGVEEGLGVSAVKWFAAPWEGAPGLATLCAP
jgi:hypothetical protein